MWDGGVARFRRFYALSVWAEETNRFPTKPKPTADMGLMSRWKGLFRKPEKVLSQTAKNCLQGLTNTCRCSEQCIP